MQAISALNMTKAYLNQNMVKTYLEATRSYNLYKLTVIPLTLKTYDMTNTSENDYIYVRKCTLGHLSIY